MNERVDSAELNMLFSPKFLFYSVRFVQKASEDYWM